MKKYKKILVLGAGPVKIGQSLEFDYSAVQVCRALKEEGIEVIFVNSTPSSVATDKIFADRVYIEPLNIDSVKKILEKERPDALLATAGGDDTLELSLELSQNGYLEETNTVLLGVEQEALIGVKNRHSFAEYLDYMGEPSVDALVVNSADEAVEFSDKIGYPVIVRPAFTQDKKSAEFCYNSKELYYKASKSIEDSVVSQILIEKSIYGWKEIEIEVLRDVNGTCKAVATAENIDSVGIHTGDSIVTVPAQTLTIEQENMLVNSAKRIAEGFKIVGSTNVQFALNSKQNEYVVTGVDPRVSRTSALISKATGYRIAYMSAKIAIGKLLSQMEIEDLSKPTYCAVKFPKWSFDSFTVSNRQLGTLMQATGESITVGDTFKSAFLKGVRSVSMAYIDHMLETREMEDDDLNSLIEKSDDRRIFAIYEALYRGVSIEKISEITNVHEWFLNELLDVCNAEKALRNNFDESSYKLAKSVGFSDGAISLIVCKDFDYKSDYSFKAVTQKGANNVQNAFYYEVCNGDFIKEIDKKNKDSVLLIGGGPTVTGKGANTDYCATHIINSLKKLGFEVAVINNNPASITTDYQVADRVYIEPLTMEDILKVIATEKPKYAVLLTSDNSILKKSREIEIAGTEILDVNYELYRKTVNSLELFDILDDANVKHTSSRGVFVGTCLETFVVSDGEDFFVPCLCEHVEKAHINTGDSISVSPTVSVSDTNLKTLENYVKNIVRELPFKGVINMQFVIFNNDLYVTKISATETTLIPFATKASGADIIDIAVRCMVGEKLKSMNLPCGKIIKNQKYFVRVPIFSFEKLKGANMLLGEKTKSTGDVMGVGDTFDNALLKGLIAANMRVKRTGSVLVSISESDKSKAYKMANEFLNQGFRIYATSDTGKLLNANHIASSTANGETAVQMIKNNKFAYVISTLENGRNNKENELIRETALMKGVPVFTSVESAYTFARSLRNNNVMEELEVEDI